jgi:hypothetical protein
MSEAAYFPESWPLIFDFLTFVFHSTFDPDQNPVPEPKCIPIPVPLRQKVAVPAVPVPQDCYEKASKNYQG